MKPILKVTATTAVELTKKQASSIVSAVQKNHKENTVRLKEIIDSKVIAGIKLTVGTEEIDATIYTKLEKLHIQLRKNI